MTEYTIEATFLRGTGVVEKAQYGDGSLALVFHHNDGGSDRLSINLIEYGIRAPEGHIYVKTYAEGEGLPEALQRAGIARIVEADEATFGTFNSQAVLMQVLV